MDRSDYYRNIGARPGMTNDEIREAYEMRIKRLHSLDYADDPEYVQRKIAEAKYAYSVITGATAPATAKQKKARFEKFKDAVERGDEPKDFAERAKKRSKKLDDSVAEADAKKKAPRIIRDLRDSTEGQTRRVKNFGVDPKRFKDKGSVFKAEKAFGIVFIVVALSIVSSTISACQNLAFSDDYSDYDDYQYDATSAAVNSVDAVNRIWDRVTDYEYDIWLDEGDPSLERKIEWEISDEVRNELWTLTNDLSYALGTGEAYNAVEAITGDPDIYWDNDDLENAKVIISLMDAPAYEDVAGKINAYRDEEILDFSDYMRFIIDVAETQTDAICPDLEEYY